MLPFVLSIFAALSATDQVQRYAVLVGANQAPKGRATLRFSQSDAKSMKEVLTRSGRVKEEDASLLLDPKPDELLRTLDAVISKAKKNSNAMLIFYYSGHSDDEALYPHGESLSLLSLKTRLDDDSIQMRIGIIDACRGGAWTRSKGLAPSAPFEVAMPIDFSSEGSALISSSSGSENAHESDALGASFFTHHLVAGLLGAADISHDGKVTLTEAFDYAKTRTVRDSALLATAPQHPSFNTSMHGRSDVVLAQLDDSQSRLDVNQQRGPMQIIDLQSGSLVLELPEGQHAVKLALPAGKYLIRKFDGADTFGREVTISVNSTSTVAEQNLELVGSKTLRRKGTDAGFWASQQSTLSKGQFEISTTFGVSSSFAQASYFNLTFPIPSSVSSIGGASWAVSSPPTAFGVFGVGIRASVGLTERIQLSLAQPGIAVTLGNRDAHSFVPWLSIPFGWAQSTQFTLGLKTGIEYRSAFSNRSFLTSKVEIGAPAFTQSGMRLPFEHLNLQTSVGYSFAVGTWVRITPYILGGTSAILRKPTAMPFPQVIGVLGATRLEPTAPLGYIAAGSDIFGAAPRTTSLVQVQLPFNLSLTFDAMVGVLVSRTSTMYPQLLIGGFVGVTYVIL